MRQYGVFVATAVLLLSVVSAPGADSGGQSAGSLHNVVRYSAKGDGQTLDTKAISETIQECSKAGGGTVIVPPGEYLSGPIELLKNVTLHLEAGAVIKASPKLEDYPLETGRGSGESGRAGLLTARHADNIGLTGRGTIEGNGMAFVFPDRLHQGSDYEKKYTRQKDDFMNPTYGIQHGPLAHGERPGNLVRFFDCTNVLIQGVTIQNSPTWTVQVARCERVTIAGVNINSFGSDRRVPNDDGIDLVESRYVHISDCDIQTGDDCIALFGSEKVTVSNCTLSSRSAGVRVGFTGKDIRDCVFSNLVIHTSNRGLGVYVRGQGSVDNILFSDITIQTQLFTGHWWGKGEPIHVSAIPWEPNVPQLGQIRNVRFRNIIAEGESGMIVYGCEQSVIKDLSFHDVKIHIKHSPLHDSYGGNFDLRSSRDFSTALFAHDIPAVYCRYMDGVDLHGLTVEWEDRLPAFFTHGLECEYFKNVRIDGFAGGPAHPGSEEAAINLKQGRGVSICNSRTSEGTGVFLRQSDVRDAGLFMNNDLAKAGKVCELVKLPFEVSGNRLPKEPGDKEK